MGARIEKTEGKPKLTRKEAKYVQEYVKTGNGTQSALKAYDTKDYKTASVISAENLDKPRIRGEILRLMERNGMELDSVFRIHKRNMEQSDHLPTSQKAVADAYNILGIASSEKPTNNVKIAFIIEE